MLLPCAGACPGPTPHLRLAVVEDELLIDVCQVCSVERQQPLQHYARWPGYTACALLLSTHRALAKALADVTCPDCAQALCEEAPPPAPDWRPEVPIGEDFYGA